MHQAEPSLSEESQYRRLVESISDYAIYMLDPDGVVSSWNPGAARLKGYAAGEIIGQSYSRFFTEEDQAAGLPQRGLKVAGQEGRWETEGWRVRKDGSRFWAHAVIEPIRNDDGSLVGFAKITRDVTDKHEAEKTLEQTRQALFQSQKMEAVGQLTGGVAHDFNNLLTVILGGLDILSRSRTDGEPRAQRALNLARQAAERAASLTARLLAFSRRQPLKPVATDLNLLVRRMTELLHHSLGEQIEIEGVLSPRLWPVEVDQNQLETAVLNLAVNARDAMPEGGKLTVETANTYLDETYRETDTEVIPGQYVLLSVADTGAGMARDVLGHVFEPFFTTKDSGRGTGLGLSMVYGFVKQSGGHVTIYSEPGQGTCVKLYLPRYHGPDAPEQAVARSAAPGAVKDEVVLLVEDNEGVRAYAAMSLTELGYQVFEAVDAESALPLLQGEQRIDLLLTDVVLPGASGRVLADEALRLRPGLRVLFTTGYSRNAIIHHGRLDPGVELLPKPFTYDQLAADVRRVLDAPPRGRG